MSHNIDDLLEEIEILKGYKHMHQKLNEQNKRYREAINEISYAVDKTNTPREQRELDLADEITLILEKLDEALEGEE